jgi:hypothetical protein
MKLACMPNRHETSRRNCTLNIQQKEEPSVPASIMQAEIQHSMHAQHATLDV